MEAVRCGVGRGGAQRKRRRSSSGGDSHSACTPAVKPRLETELERVTRVRFEHAMTLVCLS